MFDAIFPKHWTTLQRLMWLKTNALARAVYEIVTGNPVTFTAKSAPLRQLKVAFSPVQDLHGYDSPWPAGGGVNLLPTIVAGTYELNGVKAVVAENGVITVTGQKTTSSGITLLIPLENAYTPPSGCYYHLRNSAVSSSITVGLGAGSPVLSPVNRIWQSTATPSETSQMSIYLSGTVTEELNFTIQPSVELTNSVTAWSPYSNICPISGWSSLTVEQSGRNLMPKPVAGTYSSNGIDITVDENGLIAITGQKNISGGMTINIPLESSFSIHSNQYIHLRNLVVNRSMAVNVGQNSPTIAFVNRITPASKLTENIEQIGVYLAGQVTQALDFTLQPSVEYESTATSYTPYNPLSRSISISLGDTYYSGTLDVVTGVLTVTHKIVDMGSLAWTKGNRNADNTGNVFYSTSLRPEVDINADSWCSALSRQTGGLSGWEGVKLAKYALFPNDILVAVLDEADATAFKTAVTGVQLVYGLDEPLIFQLTPQEVQSLLGENVLFSDANGDLTVTYRSN